MALGQVGINVGKIILTLTSSAIQYQLYMHQGTKVE